MQQLQTCQSSERRIRYKMRFATPELSIRFHQMLDIDKEFPVITDERSAYVNDHLVYTLTFWQVNTGERQFYHPRGQLSTVLDKSDEWILKEINYNDNHMHMRKYPLDAEKEFLLAYTHSKSIEEEHIHKSLPSLLEYNKIPGCLLADIGAHLEVLRAVGAGHKAKLEARGIRPSKWSF